MTPTSEERHASLVLRWLLGEEAAPAAGTALDWRLLHALAERNAVLVRLADWFEQRGVPLPAPFAAAAAAQRWRAQAALDAIQRVSAACTRHGIGFVLLKGLEHHPDLGHDLDLLVLGRSEESDAPILAATPGTPVGGGLRDRLAGATRYTLAESGLVLDIHHQRLGIIGEHTWYPATVVRNRCSRRIGAVEVFIPAREDRLVLQGMDRVYGRRSFRLSDVTATVAVLSGEGLDWPYIARTAQALGMQLGLSCYLSYVDQIYRALYGRDLITGAPREWLALEGWGECTFRGGVYRFPAMRVGRRLYWNELGSAVTGRNWSVASRLCLLPPVIAAGGLGKLPRLLHPATRPRLA